MSTMKPGCGAHAIGAPAGTRLPGRQPPALGVDDSQVRS
jgi:hypothetical protein